MRSERLPTLQHQCSPMELLHGRTMYHQIRKAPQPSRIPMKCYHLISAQTHKWVETCNSHGCEHSTCTKFGKSMKMNKPINEWEIPKIWREGYHGTPRFNSPYEFLTSYNMIFDMIFGPIAKMMASHHVST